MSEDHFHLENREFESLGQRYARDTWLGIETLTQNNARLPVDRIILTPEGELLKNNKTSPTNIGLYLGSLIGARDLGLISPSKSETLIQETLVTLSNLPTFEGLYFNWYDTETCQLFGEPESTFVSSVDNAWLASGLMVIENSGSAWGSLAQEVLSRMSFSLFFDPKQELFYGGYHPEIQKPSRWHYGVLNTEARMASYVGIGRFNVPESHYFHLGKTKAADNLKDQETKSDKFLSWNGSLFEALMPTMFVPEEIWSRTWRKNHQEYVQEHIKFGRDHLDGYWGISPCDNPDGDYISAGLRHLGISQRTNLNTHVVTPHSVFLSLPFYPAEAFQILERMEKIPNFYSPGLGFSDSLNALSGKVANSYLSLDQQMSFLSLFNYLKTKNIRHYFADPLENKLKPLLVNLDHVM